MKILITGITGFMGSHLAEYCLTKKKAKVFGTIFSHHLGDELKRIEKIKNKVKLFECNLTNRISVARVLKNVKPNKVFHLAAQSFVPVSWESPEDTLHNNIVSELNIFETIRELKINPIIQIAGSSEEYGLVKKNEIPIKETNPLRPLSPYGVSKVSQDMLGYQYHQSYSLKTIITRCFNTEGPRRGKQFVISSFANQIAQIERSLQKPKLYVGNLNAYRDFTDVRDTVKALWLATEKCNFGEQYNIGSGKAYKIKEMLKTLLSFTDEKIKIVKDKNRMRPSDVPILLADSAKFRKITGWKPEIPLKTTLLDTLNYWREELESY
jgi:GDP-4-dehydro-6-deoxy-D-mannose reductase